MNRYKRIDYTKYIGCHHDDNDDLVGGIPLEMVALYDSQHVSDEQARELIERDEESSHLMIIRKKHYDNILKPAVAEAKRTVKAEAAAMMCNTEW